MESTFTVDSMIKEIKSNLNKYESLLKNYEQSMTPKAGSEIEKIKKQIENNIKMVKSIAVKEEDKFKLNNYNELKEELNKRYLIIKKNANQKNEQKKLSSLISETDSNIDQKNIDVLTDEHSALKNAIQLSSEIETDAIMTNSELDEQSKRLSKSEEQVVKILKKIPLIEQLFGKIKFHKIKEKIILGIVVGIIVVLGIYLTFYR